MDKVLIKPKDGLCVRDPITKQKLKPEGEKKVLNKYWRRRLSDGDVTTGTAKVVAPKPAGGAK
jgi:hypothetical protein